MFKKHPSLFFLIFVVGGILTADFFRIPSYYYLLSVLFAFIIGMYLFQKKKQPWATIFFAMIVFSFSAFHFAVSFYDSGPNHISNIVKEKTRYHIFGKVSDWPIVKINRTEIQVSIDSMISESAGFARSVNGNILIKISDSTTSLQRGDRLEFYGTIYPVIERGNESGFDYGRYLKLKSIFGIVYISTLLDVRVDKTNRLGFLGLVDKIRSSIKETFNEMLSPNASALASGFLIGETRDIPLDIYQKFRDSGTLHLLAVSGSNVAIILLFFVVLLRIFSIPKVASSIVLITIVILFALVSYSEPSVIRASLMATLVIVAGLLQRKFDLNNIISLTALIILLVEPTQLYEVGFQLSFATAWGLIFFVSKIDKVVNIRKQTWRYKYLLLPLFIALTAQIVSAPIVLYYFKTIPLLSFVSNIVIIPLVSLAVYAVLILLLFSFILPFLGELVAPFINLLMDTIISLLNYFGGEDAIFFSISDPSVLWTLLFYLFMFVSFYAIRSKKYRRILLFISLALIITLISKNFYENRLNDQSRKISVLGIPGGAIVAMKNLDQSSNNSGDVFILDIDGRDYPIDERIIQPILKRWKIDKINKLFVLGSSYDATDDILRLATTMRADSIYCPINLKGKISDQVKFGSFDYDSNLIVYSRGSSTGFKNDGYYFVSSNLVIKIGKNSFFLTSNMENFLNSSTNQDSTETFYHLISSGMVDIGNLIQFNVDFSSVVCSKFEQTGGSQPSNKSKLLPLSPVNIAEFKNNQNIRFLIDRDSKNRPALLKFK